MLNGITTWRQGAFIDQPQYRRETDEWKRDREREEQLLVRPAPTDNAICKADTPDNAKWIAQRLNLASKLEQLTYDYATGKSDGGEIVEFVRQNVNA